jgi:DNA-binding CsgD family transcriptional regulator
MQETSELTETDAALLDMFADFLRERARERERARMDEHASTFGPTHGPAHVDTSHAQPQAGARETNPTLSSPINMLNMHLESPSGYPTGSVQRVLARPPFGSAVKPATQPDARLLSRREVEVLQLIEEGLTNREIAQRIVVEQGTVKRHVHNILSKLNARNRTEAVAKARNPLGL